MPIRNLGKNEVAIGNLLNRGITAAERKVALAYRRALMEIQGLMTVMYERHAVDGVLSLAAMTQYNRLNNMEKQIREIMRDAYGTTTRTIRKLTPKQYEAAYYHHAWAIDQNTGVTLQWGVLNHDAVKAAVANPMEKIAFERLRVGGVTRVNSAVAQGLTQGSSYLDMVKSIREKVNGTADDAMRIVRTEGQRAQVMGQDATYARARAQGVKGTRIWDATLDARTRADHGSMDGVPESEEGTWTFPDGVVTKAPLQSGVAKQDINCRCRLRFEIEELEPKLRRRRDKGVTPYTRYKDWKKEVEKQRKRSELVAPEETEEEEEEGE